MLGDWGRRSGFKVDLIGRWLHGKLDRIIDCSRWLIGSVCGGLGLTLTMMMLATDWCCAIRVKWLGEATQELGRRTPSQWCRVSVVAEREQLRRGIFESAPSSAANPCSDLSYISPGRSSPSTLQYEHYRKVCEKGESKLPQLPHLKPRAQQT